jgi:hypothetical protein
MPGSVLNTHGIPDPLRTAVVDTLDAYNQDCGRRGRDHLTEAVARTHYAFRCDYATIEKEGPHAAANGLLVYSIPTEEWSNLAQGMEVWEKAESWSRRVHVHCSDRVARSDPHVTIDNIRSHYDTEDRQPVVVEYP